MGWTGVPVTSDVSGNYITKTELENYGVAISDIDDEQLALLIADVEAAIDRHTGDQFYLTSGATKYFDGNYKDRLFFMPVTSLRLRAVTSVDFWNMVTSAVTLSLTVLEDYRLADSCEYLQRTDGGLWTEGSLNVRVVGDWGWETCPEPIRWCAALMIAHRVDPDFKGLFVDNTLKWPHLSIGRDTTGKRIASIMGIPSIDLILWNYRRITSFMAAP